MSPFFLFAVIILAVVAMVIAISKFNVHPFIVLVVVAVAVGLVCGLDTVTVVDTVKSGFGDIKHFCHCRICIFHILNRCQDYRCFFKRSVECHMHLVTTDTFYPACLGFQASYFIIADARKNHIGQRVLAYKRLSCIVIPHRHAYFACRFR